MPVINYKFGKESQVYFLGDLPAGTSMLAHITDNILVARVTSICINIHDGEFITYNIITTNLTQNRTMHAVKEEFIFKTKADALGAAIKEVERRKAVVEEDLNKRIEVLDQLVIATEEAKCQSSMETSKQS